MANFSEPRRLAPSALIGILPVCALLVGGSVAQMPVAYWDFEAGTDEVLPAGGPITELAGGGTGVGVLSSGAAVGGGCLEIRETGAHLRLPASLIGAADTAFTVAAWFRFEDVGGDGSTTNNYLLALSGGQGDFARIWLRPFGTGKTLCAWAASAVEGHQNTEIAPTAADGEWHHVAMTFDVGRNLLINYFDGVLVNREQLAENAGALRAMSELVIGDSSLRNGQQNWDGQIDEVVMYESALTANQIAALAGQTAAVSALPVAVADPPNAPAEPFTPGSWQFGVLPDLQKYVWQNGSNAVVLHSIVDWLVAQKDVLDIGFVGTVGDLTAKNHTSHWTRIRSAFNKLDGELPYVLCLGNHDTGANGWARDRGSMLVNDYFDLTDNPKVDPATGGTLIEAFEYLPDGDAAFESTAHEFVAPDGQEWLLISLEFAPRQAVVDWAAAICERPEFREHLAVLFVHSYLYENDEIYQWPDKNDSNGIQFGNPHGTHLAIPDDDVHDGTDLWEELVRTYPQFRMVCCGSVSASDGTGYRMTRNDYGDEVHQMLFDPEWRYQGGNGFFRLIEILPGGRQAQVRSFSPSLEGQGMFPYITTPDCQFAIGLDPAFAGYDRWAEESGLAAGVPNGDPDGDGVANVAEFGLVRDPTNAEGAPATLRRRADGGLSLDFPFRRKAADFGLSVEVQSNFGLEEAGWQTVVATPAAMGASGSVLYGEADPHAELLHFDLGDGTAEPRAQFYRLVIGATTP